MSFTGPRSVSTHKKSAARAVVNDGPLVAAALGMKIFGPLHVPQGVHAPHDTLRSQSTQVCFPRPAAPLLQRWRRNLSSTEAQWVSMRPWSRQAHKTHVAWGGDDTSAACPCEQAVLLTPGEDAKRTAVATGSAHNR